MPHIKLFGSFTSPFTRKVRVALGEKGIAFEHDSQSRRGTAPHNPLGLVPVMVVDGRDVIYDSVVIVEYLEWLVPSPPLLPPPGMDRTMVKRWEALADGICEAGGLYVREQKRGELRSAADADRLGGRVENGLEAASRQLGARDWCHGGAFSLGDAMVGVALAWLVLRVPERVEGWQQRYGNLFGLHERLMQRPAFAATAIPGAPLPVRG